MTSRRVDPTAWLARAAAESRVIDAEVGFSRQHFVQPLVLSTGQIEAITQADARVRVEVGGVEVEGRGCIFLSDLWAWPDPDIEHATRDAAMRRCCEAYAQTLPRDYGQPAHPLATGLRLHEDAVHGAIDPTDTPTPPALARSVCVSIFDAAVHDAVGRALRVSAFDLYDDDLPVEESDRFFDRDSGTFAAIRRLLDSPPRECSPAWWLVGQNDDLETSLRPRIQRDGYRALKLKILGRSSRDDADRVATVYRAARAWGVDRPRLSIDSNEANPDAASVAEFLDRLEADDPDAYTALEMIEQPTGRDIELHAHDWSAVAARKPVMVDEGLIDLPAMQTAKAQQWSGFALKTCKGHSFTLAAAAWAHRHGMPVSLQDLTNPGLSAVHAALFAARVPTINGVELNSPQFTPAANEAWLERYPGLFDIGGGEHQLPDPNRVAGLGSQPD